MRDNIMYEFVLSLLECNFTVRDQIYHGREILEQIWYELEHNKAELEPCE